eukprot:NODE_483_length_1644_cov_60.713480_g344_i0.p1 GENE.NODE_483_length_1644_cov_60.713480_g344_i0~~NODE_483_length_1644_cov_60.713480_g344_i0.p1  ORF type:complete len:415 (-),score=88.53 NODE_483_length_1644_cov_60.713480_g344_i0:341-1585(-)
MSPVDGLRAISHLMIVMHHVLDYWLHFKLDPATINSPWRYATVNTSLALETFFALTGFLITMSTSSSPNRAPGAVLCSRVFRLIPGLLVYWVATMALGYLPLLTGSATNVLEALHCDTRDTWQNLVFVDNLQSFLPHWARAHTPSGVNHCMNAGWSMSMQVQFYIMVALCTAAPIRIPRGFIFLLPVVAFATNWGLTAITPALPSPIKPDWEALQWWFTFGCPTWRRIGSIVAGAVAGQVATAHPHQLAAVRASWAMRWVGSLALSGFYLYLLFTPPQSVLSFDAGLLVSAYMSLVVLLMVGWRSDITAKVVESGGLLGVVARALSLPFWRPISQASFFSYLLHGPIIILGHWWHPYPPEMDGVAYVLRCAVVVPLSLMAGWVGFRVLERRTVLWCRRLLGEQSTALGGGRHDT